MTNTLRLLHRWLGFPVGLLFLITFGTGFLTALDELITRGTLTGFIYSPQSLEQQAQSLETLSAQHTDIRMITLPTPEAPYYQVVKRNERISYGMQNLTPVWRQLQTEDDFFATVLQLHRTLLLGREGWQGLSGSDLVAILSLLALLLSLIGLYLWWPLRQTFQLKKILPTQAKRSAFYYAHLTSGIVCLALIILMSITGAAMTYRSFTQQLLGITPTKATFAPIQLEHNWHAWLNAAQQQMPDATLSRIQFPRPEGPKMRPAQGGAKAPALLTLRFTHTSDWFGLANSQVQLDTQKSQLLNHSRFGDLSLAEKLFALLNPLHTGRGLADSYVWVLLLLSALGVVMVASSIISFVLKQQRRRVKNSAPRMTSPSVAP